MMRSKLDFRAETGKFGKTIMTRVSEMDEIKDLLEQYAAGSLYMAEMLAPQKEPLLEEHLND